MDITLERILSLLPRKPDGKYVHGAKKAFADKLGIPANLVTMWENKDSGSYMNYLYEISAKFGVSVEWLRGETDEKAPPEPGEDAIKLLEEMKERPDLRLLLDAARVRSPKQVLAMAEFFKQTKEDE